MSLPRGPVLCVCGQPATPSSRRRGERRCLDCSIALVSQVARELRAKSGPYYERWETSGGAHTLEQNRKSPAFAAAARANAVKARAALARQVAAAKGLPAAQSPPETAPVPSPQPVRTVPQTLFYYGR